MHFARAFWLTVSLPHIGAVESVDGIEHAKKIQEIAFASLTCAGLKGLHTGGLGQTNPPIDAG